MFRLNLKVALRNLWKNKGFTLINVGGLAIGLASCILLLLYVSYEWSYDKQFSNYQKTYVVYNNIKASNEIISVKLTPNIMAAEIRETVPGVAYASHSALWGGQLISYGNNKFKKDAITADPSFLKMLDYKFIKGNPNAVLREVNTVILTKALAENLFGSEDPINKIVKFDNKEPLRVEAIIDDLPSNSSIKFDFILPWAIAERLIPGVKVPNWGDNSYLTLVQLQNNSFLDQANAVLKGIYLRNDKNTTSEAMLQPLARQHLYSEYKNGKSVGGKIEQLRIFLILAFCILLIACINFMNLTTAKSEKRAKEVGVRKAIGSSRKTLIGQFLTESLLLSTLSTTIACVLVEMSLPYFNNILSVSLRIDYQNWGFWLTLLGLTVFTGLLAGSYPAFYLSSFTPVKVLNGLNNSTGLSFSIRKILVVFQFGFAACLIICTTVIYQQLNYIKNRPIGYNKNHLVQIALQGNLHNASKLELLRQQLLKSRVATHVTFFNSDINFNSRNTAGITWSGKNPNENILFNYRSAGYDFVKTLGTKMVAGREFSDRYVDSNSVMVNEAAVKAMDLKTPIGTTITFWDRPVIIIGVMKNFVSASPYQKVTPMVFHPIQKFKAEVVLIRLDSTLNLSNALAKVDDIVKTLNPDYPVDRTFLDESFEKKFKEERLLGTLANWFGGFAIFISCLGLLGLALYMAEKRKKEISVRKVLGASMYSILVLLNTNFLKLVVIANLVAFPVAYVLVNKWLSLFDFRVTISPFPFILAALTCVGIALLTVSIQSVRVAKANPVDALRSE